MALAGLMRKYRAIAQSGDAAACREAIAGSTLQETPFRTEGRFGRHLVVVDEPTSFGGSDTAANPAEVMLAGLGASIAVTLRCHAALRGLEVGRIEVEMAGDLDIRGFFDADPAVRSGFQSLTVTVRMESSASPEQLAELRRAADRGCPVLDACRGATPIHLSWE